MKIIVNISQALASWQKNHPTKKPSATDIATMASSAWRVKTKAPLTDLIAVSKGQVMGYFSITNISQLRYGVRFTLSPTQPIQNLGNLKYFYIKYIP